MTSGGRQHNLPLIIWDETSDAVPLEPIPLDRPPFREDRLQHLLATHPRLLPIAELEPAFAPLIPLGREIPTPSGYLDVLYTSPSGYLTLVEAKLWDNPEARREVIGQIVDYAKDFSRWRFEDLDAAVRRAGNPGILDAVRQTDPDLDEIAYIDNVNRTLRRGACLLLVVGNGIREGVEALTAFLQRTPSLHFSLALVELGLFRAKPGSEWPLLIQPRTVARTVEVVRAVVDVRAPAAIEVTVTLPEDSARPTIGARRTLTEEAFFSRLRENTSESIADGAAELIGDLRSCTLEAWWRASSVSLRMPDPGGLDRYWTVVVITVTGSFYLGWLAKISEEGGYKPAVWQAYLQRVTVLTGAKGSDKTLDSTKPAPLTDLLARAPEFVSLVQNLVEDLRREAGDRPE
jgi:hypothetical protein